jgi:hypothetical protein
LALLTVALSWPLERKVDALRIPRNESVEAYLKVAGPDTGQLGQQATVARATFGMWHGISLLLNFATIGLVAVAVIMTAFLPQPASVENPPPATSRNGPHAGAFGGSREAAPS